MTFFQFNILPTGECYYKPQEARPHLTTAKVEKRGNIRKLEKLAGEWNSLAEERKQAALASWLVPQREKNLADDSELLTYIIKKQLHKNQRKTKVYVSYSDDKKIQGIAIACIQDGKKKGCNELKDLATHPQNVAIFGDDMPIRGVGTSLIVTVVKDVLKRKEGCKSLHLEAVNSAVPFYEKLGFTVDTKKKPHENVVYMVLRREGMLSLVRQHAPAIDFEKKEPKLKPS